MIAVLLIEHLEMPNLGCFEALVQPVSTGLPIKSTQIRTQFNCLNLIPTLFDPKHAK